jgi:chromosome condensin MukBEF complex kleisin-like MukF subunit
LQEQTGRAALLARELDASQTSLAAQQQVVASLTEELKGQRLFAMQAIEMGRGETRLVKERVAELQAKNDRLETMVDQLRMARGNAEGMR